MTSTQFEAERSVASIHRLPLIIDLLYGFAIGNGLSDALGSALNQHDPLALALLVAATAMAFGDWLAYHIHVSHIPYTSVWRLLLDMIFPMIIYLLLLSPTLSEEIYSGAYVATLLAIYFAGGILWLHLLSREQRSTDPYLKLHFLFCAALAMIASIIGWYPFAAGEATKADPHPAAFAIIADMISMIVILVWTAYNIRCVRNWMMEAQIAAVSPDSPAAQRGTEP